MDVKYCPKCQEFKPATLECFSAAKYGKYKLSGWCKQCKSSYQSEISAEKRSRRQAEKLLQEPEGFKICPSCRHLKPLDTEHFYRAADKLSGFQSRCKDCAKQMDKKKSAEKIERSKRWRRENPEAVKINREIYRKNNREAIKIRRRSYYLKNREHYIAKAAEWQKLNPQKSKAIRKAYDHRRRVWELATAEKFTWADVLNQLKAQNNQCHWCKAPLREDYHVDHVIPLSKGGSNSANNIVCTCPGCNLRKGSKLPVEWELWRKTHG